MNLNKLAMIVIGLMIIPALACGSSATKESKKEPTRASVILATATLAKPPVEEAAKKAEVPTLTPAPAPTNTPEPPTPVPAPVYQEQVKLGEYSGTGGIVSDNFTLPTCQKAVFNYSVQASDAGYASLILKLNRVGGDREMILVNAMKKTPKLVGQAMQSLLGGEYFFTSENTKEPWQVVIECHDNTAPITEGLDVAGEGPTVTKNYHLTACKKSVFVWESKAGEGGYASIIATLVQTNIPKLRGGNVINEMKKGDISGEALQVVETGDYFLVIENVSGPWHVRWECRD